MKKILSRAAVKRVDEATTKRLGGESIDLMENAAQAFLKSFTEIYDGEKIIVLCGPGNNGGDGLAVARLIHDQDVNVDVFYLKANEYSNDFIINLKRLQQTKVNVTKIHDASQLSEISTKSALSLSNASIIIDALYGTGLNKPLTEPAAGIVQWMNKQYAIRVSIDVPSGMTEHPHSVADIMVNADHVIAFQIPRLDLLIPRDGYNPLSIQFVDIGLDKNSIESENSDSYLIEEADIKKLLLKRKVFDHKWNYGHALIVAGTRNTMGAALLATGSALRSGCGLVTTHLPKNGATALNTLYPEAMLSHDLHNDMITDVPMHNKYNGIGIGCGIGKTSETSMALIDVLTKSKLPVVLDADALTLLSEQHDWKSLIPQGSILTPHHKEFDRLTEDQPNDYERMQIQLQLATEINAVIIVKGAYTRIALPNGKCYFNSSGTTALATAGTGDVLTGLLTGLLARGYTSEEASLIGVYVHGIAAQLASKESGIENMIASDIIKHLPLAFNRLYS